MAATNFSLTVRPGSFRSTIGSPCVPALPRCSSGLGGIASPGLSNVHVKGNLSGKLFALLFYIFGLTVNDCPSPYLVWSSHHK